MISGSRLLLIFPVSLTVYWYVAITLLQPQYWMGTPTLLLCWYGQVLVSNHCLVHFGPIHSLVTTVCLPLPVQINCVPFLWRRRCLSTWRPSWAHPRLICCQLLFGASKCLDGQQSHAFSKLLQAHFTL